MRKVFLCALAAGMLVLPMTNAEAYHVIKQHKNAEPVAITQPAVITQQPVAPANECMSASAVARTDRSLISEEAPASLRDTNQPKLPAPVVDNGAKDYKMRSGDQLQIVVYGHEDLSTKPGVSYTPYVVRPDGNLAMPLIGDVNCSGKTVPQVAEEITNRLAEYIIDPQVTINVTKLGTTRVYVLGEARQQGLYELDKSHTLLDAVSRAGGFTAKSAKRKVYVVRQGMNNFVTKVDMLDILKKGASANLELQEGDCVYISSNHKVQVQQILSMAYYIANAAKNIDDVRD